MAEAQVTSQGLLIFIKAVAEQAVSEGDLRTALRAAELLGKHIGLFKGKAAEQGGILVTICDYTDDQEKVTEYTTPTN